jgi:hypothetical protein
VRAAFRCARESGYRAPARDPFDNTSMTHPTSASPPDGLPTYRILTGPDDAAFCHRVSAALALGYKLYGSPAATFNGANVIVAQAMIWPSIEGSVSA